MNDNPRNNPDTEPEEDEEVAHLDDATVGKAFRLSGIALVLIVLATVATLAYLKRKPEPAPIQNTTITAPVAPDRSEITIPKVTFTDITSQAGIDFIHNNGATGEKLLPESLGGGVAFLDFDNDNDQDLLFINGTWWPDKTPGGKQPTTSALYRNDGTGKFQNVTPGSGLDVSLYGMGTAVGDYDNDGRVDIFITAVGANHLFRNLGEGRFLDVTAAAGVAGPGTEWSSSSAWFDHDNDGDLDLFVANYVRWSRAIDFEVDFRLDGVNRAYGPPMNFPGTFPSFYRNDGNGMFTDISEASGIRITNSFSGEPGAKSLGLAPADLDRDGWMDLIVANDTVPNFVFHNQGNGTFKEIGALSSIAFDNSGRARGAMGIDTGFFHDDASLGVAIGNFANEMIALYVSSGNSLLFTDNAISEGVGPASRLLLKFGIFFFDYDLDGRLDLLSCNGHLEEEINTIQKSQHYAQPAQLFWNCGPKSGATFINVTADHCGPDLVKEIVGRGSAFADIDGDGDLDVILTQLHGPPLLLRNDQKQGHNWVRLKLEGSSGNRDAIGAMVRMVVDDRVLLRQVMPTRSYLSQSELPVTFGLGTNSTISLLEITWPNGAKQTAPLPPLNQLTVLRQP